MWSQYFIIFRPLGKISQIGSSRTSRGPDQTLREQTDLVGKYGCVGWDKTFYLCRNADGVLLNYLVICVKCKQIANFGFRFLLYSYFRQFSLAFCNLHKCCSNIPVVLINILLL